MKRRSPTLGGFQTLFRLPSLGLAEIAWRWSFGLAVTALVVFSFYEYLATLPVTPAEVFWLRSRQPALILQTIARILGGSAPRAFAALVVLTLTLTIAWIVLASLGRATTLNALLEYFRTSQSLDSRQRLAHDTQTISMAPLIGLNFFRAITTLAAGVGSVGAILLAGASSPEKYPSPGSALLIFYVLAMCTVAAWLLLNWFFSLAAVFIADRRDTFAALGAAVDLCWSRPGSLIAATTLFGLAHVLALVLASSAAALPLAFIGVLPGAVVLGGVLLVGLSYFAVVDFLYAGRLATYVLMTEVPESSFSESRNPPIGTESFPQSDEDILSDVPGLVPPPETA